MTVVPNGLALPSSVHEVVVLEAILDRDGDFLEVALAVFSSRSETTSSSVSLSIQRTMPR